ncbi:hypothetical protein SAMN04488602_1141, partial [Paenibacillus sp. cl123]
MDLSFLYVRVVTTFVECLTDAKDAFALHAPVGKRKNGAE